MDAATIRWTLLILTWAYLVRNGVRLRLIRRYPWVYAMILASVVRSVFLHAFCFFFGIQNHMYAWWWAGWGYLAETLTAVVLLHIFSVSEGFSLRKHWPVPVAAGVAFCIPFAASPKLWVFAQIYSGLRLGVFALGFAALFQTVRNRNLRLGWNLSMVLLAVTVPDFFHYIVFNSYVLGAFSYETTAYWSQFTGLATWIVLAAGMMEHSPPTSAASTASTVWAASGADSKGKEQPST